MILSVGEILADMIGQKVDGVTTFKAFCGGAPFNLAVNAKQSGAKVGFVGRVGNDVIGRFVLCEAQKAHLDRLDIQIDAERNTTIAFVTLTDGERDFAFNRHDTADFNLDFDDIDFESYENLEIVHLGSLMLSEQKGREFAEKIANKASELGAKLSFDMNFRKDIYKNFEDAKRAYAPFVERADIIKFSDDELADYTGISDMDEAAKSVLKKDKLLLVTLGKSGSAILLQRFERNCAEHKRSKVCRHNGRRRCVFRRVFDKYRGQRTDERKHCLCHATRQYKRRKNHGILRRDRVVNNKNAFFIGVFLDAEIPCVNKNNRYAIQCKSDGIAVAFAFRIEFLSGNFVG